jgi:hypothetical protein
MCTAYLQEKEEDGTLGVCWPSQSADLDSTERVWKRSIDRQIADQEHAQYF